LPGAPTRRRLPRCPTFFVRIRRHQRFRVDGILFWTIVLDPRRNPPAPVSFGGRLAMALVIVPPQIVLGAIIAFSTHDVRIARATMNEQHRQFF
jgi:hypothetical protein